VAPNGENQIAVAPGANARLDPAGVARSVEQLLADGGVLLASLEVPGAAVEAAARAGRARGATVILNPAPAGAAAAGLVALADVLTPNEVEAAALERHGLLRAARPDLCLIETRGPEGVRVRTPDAAWAVPAVRRPVVDTTGAGDAFNGALAAALLEGRPLEDAVRRAVAAAGLSVTVAGAREGLPLRAAIDAVVEGAPGA
jgi:ribokinase